MSIIIDTCDVIFNCFINLLYEDTSKNVHTHTKFERKCINDNTRLIFFPFMYCHGFFNKIINNHNIFILKKLININKNGFIPKNINYNIDIYIDKSFDTMGKQIDYYDMTYCSFNPTSKSRFSENVLNLYSQIRMNQNDEYVTYNNEVLEELIPPPYENENELVVDKNYCFNCLKSEDEYEYEDETKNRLPTYEDLKKITRDFKLPRYEDINKEN